MSEALQFTFTKVVKCEDADGQAIHEGSVLKHIEDGGRGVVIKISTPGCRQTFMLESVGDVAIRTRPGSTRHTNKYSMWRHVPHEDQTYEERYQSWLHSPARDQEDLELFYSERLSRDTLIAIDGIMALLPSADYWDRDSLRPDRIEGALGLLAEHLEGLKAQPSSNP